MRPNLLAATFLLAACLFAVEQTETQSSATVCKRSSTATATTYLVVERGEHFRCWQAISAVTTQVGEGNYVTNVYTEIQNRLCFRAPNTGEWQDASDQIEIQPDGGVVAERGQSRLYLPEALCQEGE